MVEWRQVGLDVLEFVVLVFHLVFCYCDYIYRRFIVRQKLKSLVGEIILVRNAKTCKL